jgi:hypothetical protein
LFLNKGADSITAPLSLLHLGPQGTPLQDHKTHLQRVIEERLTNTTCEYSTFRAKVALLRKEIGIPTQVVVFPNQELYDLWENISDKEAMEKKKEKKKKAKEAKEAKEKAKKEKEMGAKGGKK